MKYREGFKYQLAEVERFQTRITGHDIKTKFVSLGPGGMLTIKAGFAWDGPSGPTLDSKNSMRAALAHDAIYYLIRNEHLAEDMRGIADNVFDRILKEDGMWAPRRNLWVWAVKRLAAAAADPDNRKEVFEAP